MNHFIVSQARPQFIPFLQPSMHTPLMRGRIMDSLSEWKLAFLRSTGTAIRHRLELAARLGWLPAWFCRLFLDERTPSGNMILVPQVPLREYVRLLDSPTRESLRYWIHKGEKCVWPAVAALKVRCSVELALNDAVETQLSDEPRSSSAPRLMAIQPASKNGRAMSE